MNAFLVKPEEIFLLCTCKSALCIIDINPRKYGYANNPRKYGYAGYYVIYVLEIAQV